MFLPFQRGFEIPFEPSAISTRTTVDIATNIARVIARILRRRKNPRLTSRPTRLGAAPCSVMSRTFYEPPAPTNRIFDHVADFFVRLMLCHIVAPQPFNCTYIIDEGREKLIERRAPAVHFVRQRTATRHA